jgi:aminopeptidase N
VRASLFAVLLLTACGGDDAQVTPDAPADEPDAAPDAPLVPTPNPTREVVRTELDVDVTTRMATARITVGPSADPGMTLEIGDLTVADIADAVEAPIAFNVINRRLNLALPASADPLTFVITYQYKLHEDFNGQSMDGYTLLWPYHCGNLFPCHSAPADGTEFTLSLSGIPAGQTAVYPTTLTEAPSYQIAWSVDDYTELSLGTTDAGTEIVVWHRPGEEADANAGTDNLVAAFNWLETTLGPYRFGPKAGTVSVGWGPGAFGGMEHHPFWHVADAALSSDEVNVHEAAHGWYGDGIRYACWEDFVLSEGTVSYLAGRALDVVNPAVGAEVWQSYAALLDSIPGTLKVWPQTCNEIDIIADNLFTNAPYMRGAFFYRALAQKLGATVVDDILHDFYVAHAGKAARMSEMLELIEAKTGYDPTACAQTWLLSTTKPTPGPCP